jgi:hypothetical protein
MEKATQKLEELTQKLSAVKGHITVMSKTEKHLALHIQELSVTCADLDATVSDLDKVRDAIHIFDVCAGLGRPSFHIPMFTGQIIEVEYDTTTKQDDKIDADLNFLCSNVSYNGIIARAAETSEIMQQAIDGMPSHNTANAPLLGTCPHCAGDADTPGGPVHASGHARTCWDAGSLLDGVSMRSNCGHLSYKAVLCVADRFDVAGNLTIANSSVVTITSSSGSSSSSTSE